jgi:hypothetical protein
MYASRAIHLTEIKHPTGLFSYSYGIAGQHLDLNAELLCLGDGLV